MQTQSAHPEYFGRYQVVEELGSGAMGVVYLCVDSLLARPVAVKMVRENAHATPPEHEQYLARFRQEAEAAGRLNHPSIVQIYDIGPSYIVMEFLEGRPLSALIGRDCLMTVGEACAIVKNVADALDFAHRNGVVHRDVKPANIMVLADGGVKVLDFGVARLSTSSLTLVGTVVGSVRYMAPEQMLGHRVDGKADLFSLATMAYEMLTAHAPYPGRTITEVVSRVVQGRHVPPRECDPRLPEAVNAVFVRAFAARPEGRHALAADFAADLEAAARPAFDLTVRYGGAADDEQPGTMHSARTMNGAAPTTAAAPAAAPAAGAGVIVVESEPPGARVCVDGRPMGLTPASVTVAFGRHGLRLDGDGHAPVELWAEVTRERPLRAVTVSLPAAAVPARFVDFGPDVTPPRRVAGSAPVYPEAARARGIEGAPVLEIWVGEEGDVLDLSVVESAGSLLDTALLEAVAGWRFAPALRAGVPVAVRMTVQHVFRV
jgi:serine/threonine-protein kinase